MASVIGAGFSIYVILSFRTAPPCVSTSTSLHVVNDAVDRDRVAVSRRRCDVRRTGQTAEPRTCPGRCPARNPRPSPESG